MYLLSFSITDYGLRLRSVKWLQTSFGAKGHPTAPQTWTQLSALGS